MSSNNIPDRKNGQTILASWFNLLKQLIATIERKILFVDGDYSVASGYNTIICDASLGVVNITLPDASLNSGVEIVIIASIADNTNRVNILPQGSSKVLGQSSIFLRMNNESIRLVTEGVNWYASA